MAKTKNAKSKKQPRARRPGGPVRLDAAGLAYARLLADPCNAPLAHPTYGGTGGGYLLRAESFLTYSAGATGGGFIFTPGAIGSGDTELGVFANDNPGLATTVLENGVDTPGKSFLRSNASAVRCVAACVKVSYPGSEANRSGRIHYGQVNGGLAVTGSQTSVNNLAQVLPHYGRTPAEEVEIVWKPNDADQLTRDPNQATAIGDLERRSAIAVAWAGLPAGTGLTFRLTVVWEWQPDTGKGLSNPNLNKSPSNNSLDHVVNYLISSGFRFVGGAAHAAAYGMASGAYSAMSNMFGVMPARQINRSVRNLAQ